MIITDFAPAKINLSLLVTGRQPDGYHLLHSLVAFADFGDAVIVDPAGPAQFHVTGPFAGALSRYQDQNLVLSARDSWAAAMGVSLDWAITLVKNLPVASGIGGGSADAAAMLRILTQYWPETHQLVDIAAIALSLGADVPVCMERQTCWMYGIGEQIMPAPGLFAWPLLLVNPGIPVSTPRVFAHRQGPFSQLDPADMTLPHRMREQMAWLATAQNDLTEAASALVPEIAALLQIMANHQGIFTARMSGSGATCFALGKNHQAIAKLAAELSNRYPDYWIQTGQLIGESLPV